VEYGLGHKTHLRFLQDHLARDPRFQAEIIPLHWMDRLGDLLGKLQIPGLHERGLDFSTWLVFQFKRQQVGYLLRKRDPKDLDLVYIHTQTAATSVLDLPRSVPAVVSIDLTWKLAFAESRYVASPFFKPTIELERRIFERSDLVVSFSDWAAASVIDDYKIPASKVRVVRNGVTLPTAYGHVNGNGHGRPFAANGDGHAQDGNGRFARGRALYKRGARAVAGAVAAGVGGGGNGHGDDGGYGYGGGNGHGGGLGFGNGHANGHGLGNGNGNGHANGHGHGNGNGNGYGLHPYGHGHGQGHGADAGDGLLKIGFIGNGFTRKGADLLLRVHQEHFADRAHLTLVCGDAPRASRGLPNVDVRADVPWMELMTSVLPGFELFVFPTRFDYSPYAVIEAMSAGVPVIATNVGAIPEMIQDGHSGFLIEADREAALVERVDWALANREALPAMGARARARAADHYAAERNYPHLLDVLAGMSRGR
jgi:glycosyltransferase involved in cell wall biosynthesis